MTAKEPFDRIRAYIWARAKAVGEPGEPEERTFDRAEAFRIGLGVGILLATESPTAGERMTRILSEGDPSVPPEMHLAGYRAACESLSAAMYGEAVPVPYGSGTVQ